LVQPPADQTVFGFDDRLARMWSFYLATCEAVFGDRKPGTLQLAPSRSGERPRPIVQGATLQVESNR
jgi:hypothetical protein